MIREKTTKTVAANPALDRRTVLKATGAAAFTIGAPMIWRKASAQDRRIVIRDPGGPYEKGFGEAFYQPFTEATGIEAVGVAGQHEPTSLIKAMVDTGSYTWDMALLSRSAHNQLVTEGDGYLEELNLDTPGIQEVPERFRTPYYVGNNVFTAILAYRTDAFEGREPPKNWQDLWDVEGFPGRRALRKHPFDRWRKLCWPTGCRRTSSTRSTSTGRSPASTGSTTRSRSGGKAAPRPRSC